MLNFQLKKRPCNLERNDEELPKIVREKSYIICPICRTCRPGRAGMGAKTLSFPYRCSDIFVLTYGISFNFVFLLFIEFYLVIFFFFSFIHFAFSFHFYPRY